MQPEERARVDSIIAATPTPPTSHDSKIKQFNSNPLEARDYNHSKKFVVTIVIGTHSPPSSLASHLKLSLYWTLVGILYSSFCIVVTSAKFDLANNTHFGVGQNPNSRQYSDRSVKLTVTNRCLFLIHLRLRSMRLGEGMECTKLKSAVRSEMPFNNGAPSKIDHNETDAPIVDALCLRPQLCVSC